VLIVDSQRVVVLGLAAVFAGARNCQVVAEGTSAQQAVELAHEHRPDVVVLDADLPQGSAINAASTIVADNDAVRVIMFGSVPDPQAVIAAIHAGVCGYMLKRTDPAQLVDAVEMVASGGYFFDDACAAAVLEWFRTGRPAGDPLARLSQQELRILRRIAEGKTNRDIAVLLGLSEYTVKTYVSAALRKLGLSSRAEAAAFITRQEPSS
jgi:DNA-binding NarL/FixJ family response regulator